MDVPQLDAALAALLKFQTAASCAPAPTSTLSLFASPMEGKRPASVDVEVSFRIAPAVHRVPLFFRLPHQVLNGTICLVTPSPQRKYKDTILAATADQDKIATQVRKTMDTIKLKAKFTDVVSLRALSKSFDHFVCYNLNKYPKQLTGEFLNHQSIPVWIPKAPGGVLQALKTAVNTVVVPRRGHSNVTCTVGSIELTALQLKENILTFLKLLTGHEQGSPMENILTVRVAGANKDGKRATLTVYCHNFVKNLPAPPAAHAEETEEPKKKKRRQA
jgi:hypothetical protein